MIDNPQLVLGDIITALGVDLDDVLVIRHTFRPDGLRGPSDLTNEGVEAYTRIQYISPRSFPREPPRTWLVFITDGQLRSRFFGAFENRGELLDLRTDERRTFDLQPSDALASLKNRLVVQWQNARTWHRQGHSATGFTVVEIADPETKRFPGYDHVLLTHDELREVVTDSRYASWQTALGSVQGIYLITDTSNGKHYVGKADGAERILGRWTPHTRVTATAATLPSASWPDLNPNTLSTSCSAFFGFSDLLLLPARSMPQRLTTSELS